MPPAPEAFTNAVSDKRCTGIMSITTEFGLLALCSWHPGTLPLREETFSNPPQNAPQLLQGL